MTDLNAPLEWEIFHSGTYKDVLGRDITFDENALDEICKNYYNLAEYIKPPLKLGHSDKQIFAQPDGQPSLGWVQGLKRIGPKLVASVVGIPQVVRDAIQAGRFKRVSAEFHLNFAKHSYEKNLNTGVKGRVLEAVALLGAELPQVPNLEDITAYLDMSTPSANYLCASFPFRSATEDRFVPQYEPAPVRLSTPEPEALK
jgi:hypothetical protein